MTIRVTIKNEEPAGSTAVLALTVVTVGNLEAAEHKEQLAAQQSTTVHVHAGQFVMVDETEKD